jgi:hypothetical protein
MQDLNRITDVVFDGVDHSDYPDYCDVYVVSAKIDGVDMTEQQLDELDSDTVYELLLRYFY